MSNLDKCPKCGKTYMGAECPDCGKDLPGSSLPPSIINGLTLLASVLAYIATINALLPGLAEFPDTGDFMQNLSEYAMTAGLGFIMYHFAVFLPIVKLIKMYMKKRGEG
ncbi:hypothetical protein [Limisalsivibrio acetivorans]|uniref:hypothetical protein n=1 Tax=Limisalsivibrio acetivorans TaxID=1304888 RepID=UPI0004026872|nr:hypothetical protein [Limisalsivibrio acetivorans]